MNASCSNVKPGSATPLPPAFNRLYAVKNVLTPNRLLYDAIPAKKAIKVLKLKKYQFSCDSNALADVKSSIVTYPETPPLSFAKRASGKIKKRHKRAVSLDSRPRAGSFQGHGSNPLLGNPEELDSASSLSSSVSRSKRRKKAFSKVENPLKKKKEGKSDVKMTRSRSSTLSGWSKPTIPITPDSEKPGSWAARSNALIITSHRTTHRRSHVRKGPTVVLPERGADGAVHYKEHSTSEPSPRAEKATMDEGSLALKNHYNEGKNYLQMLVTTVVGANLPIEPTMHPHDVHMYLRLQGISPSALYEFGKSPRSSREQTRDMKGVRYSDIVLPIIDRYSRMSAIPPASLLSKKRWMNHLVSPRLFRTSKKHLASYLILYLDMDIPTNEMYFIEIVHPILPSCTSVATSADLFEFFNITGLTKAQMVYIVLNMLELINKGKVHLKEDSPSMVHYFELESTPVWASQED